MTKGTMQMNRKWIAISALAGALITLAITEGLVPLLRGTASDIQPGDAALPESGTGRAPPQAEIRRLEHEVSRLREQLATASAKRSPVATDPARDRERVARLNATISWLTSLDDERFGTMTAEQLEHLRELDLSGLAVEQADLEHLVTLQNLVRVNLGGASITDDALAVLARMPSLQRLDLSQTLVTDAGLQHLADSETLQHLGLTGTKVTDAGLGFAVAKMKSLRRIELTSTAITDAGLLQLQHLPLETVGIGNSGVTDAGMASLQGFDLRKLDLYRNTNITDKGMEHLVTQTSIEDLMLRGLDVTEVGLRSLRHMKSLKSLNASMAMSDDGMVHLRDLTSLKTLALYSNPGITDKGVANLAGLKSLQTLQLQFTGVTDAALSHLEGLTSLRRLDVRGTKVSAAACEAFKTRHPRCRVFR